jgi:hypothetical protein
VLQLLSIHPSVVVAFQAQLQGRRGQRSGSMECSANQARPGTTICRSVQQLRAQLLAAATLTRREYVDDVTLLAIIRLGLAYLVSLHLIFVCPSGHHQTNCATFSDPSSDLCKHSRATHDHTALIHSTPPRNMSFSFGQQGNTPKQPLFGGATTNTSGQSTPGLFGTANAGSGTPGGLFGGGGNASASSPFGGASNTPASKPGGGLFGPGATSGASSTPFGGNLSKPSGETKPGLFGAGGGFGGGAGGATSSAPSFGFGTAGCKCLVRAFLAYAG